LITSLGCRRLRAKDFVRDRRQLLHIRRQFRRISEARILLKVGTADACGRRWCFLRRDHQQNSMSATPGVVVVVIISALLQLDCVVGWAGKQTRLLNMVAGVRQPTRTAA